MYLEHFGLNRPPFKITPDTSLFYAGSKRGAALEALLYAIRSGEGIIKVVGEVGSGKTMLCRMLEVNLCDDVDVVYIANPSLSPDNILHVIAHELHLDVSNDASKLDVMQKLQQYLLQKHAADRQVVVFVEEAQSMPIETLEEIRLLSNLETDQSKLLQMVLFGQPELDAKLASPEIRQLKERITHSFQLEPFAPADTLDYLNFRLRAVGYRGPDIYTRRTASSVEKYSAGLTRRINIIADKALMAAFSEGKHEVTSRHVKTAAYDSEFARPFNPKPVYAAVTIMAALALAFWTGSVVPWPPKTADVQAMPKVEKSAAQKSTVVESAPAEETTADAGDAAEQLSADEEKTLDQLVAPSRLKPSLLDKRLTETARWLHEAKDNHYSIQLFMTRIDDATAVEGFLRNVPELLDYNKIYVYETRVGGSRMYGVLYADYATKENAKSVLSSLPEEVQANKPFLRRIRALRKEVANS
jgi:MSHA biogenesis protein MshM